MLFKEISLTVPLISHLVKSKEFDTEQKNLAFKAGFKVMDFTDKQSFSLNEGIALHYGMVFVEANNIINDTIDADKLKDFSEGMKRVGVN